MYAFLVYENERVYVLIVLRVIELQLLLGNDPGIDSFFLQ